MNSTIPSVWKTIEEASDIYAELPTEVQQMKAVKEQILLRYLGLVWKEAHHSWSSEGTTFTSKYLFNHFVEKVIPLVNEREVPAEPSLTLPAPPKLPHLGEKSVISDSLNIGQFKNVEEFKTTAYAMRDDH